MSNPSANEIGLHLPRMYRVALRLVANADRAHDVVQEACVKALAGWNGFDQRASRATWLHRITVNCAMDAIRGTQRQDRVCAEAEARASTAVAAPPDVHVEQSELGTLAWKLLVDLPEDCRSAFVLTQLDGY